MKLSKEYLAIQFEHGPMLKQFYLSQQKAILEKNKQAIPSVDAQNFYVVQGVSLAHSLCAPTKKGNLFYLSQNVQKHSDLIKINKINLDWFKELENEISSYVISKTEFYRFQVIKGERINVVRWFISQSDKGPMVNYESFAVLLKEKEITQYANQNEEAKQRFVKLLLFVKLTEPELFIIKPSQKINKDIGFKGKENNFLNDTLFDVTLVNTLWNKIIVTDGFKVRGHIRIQPYGQDRSFYKLIWIDDFEKGGYTRSET